MRGDHVKIEREFSHFPRIRSCCVFTAMTSAFRDNYEPLDVIGNGSFGIIRKVRRKTDGLVRTIGPSP